MHWQFFYLVSECFQGGFASFTAWQLEKMNRKPAPKLLAYSLTWSFSHMSCRFSHDSLSLIAMVGLQYCDYLDPHLED